MFSLAQPQAPNAPFNPEGVGRFFEGLDRTRFESLGGRIVPCRYLHAHHAVDLAGRYWWWDQSEEGGIWGLVPTDEACLTIWADFEQWKLLAPVAVDTLRRLFASGLEDPDTSALRELYSFQKAALAMWNSPVPLIGRAWLYQTITLTGRWALPSLEIPAFCPGIFSVLLHGSWDHPVSEDHLGALRQDPVISQFPEIGVPIFGTTTPIAATDRPRLALVSSN